MKSDVSLAAEPVAFEPEFIDALTDVFERQIAFNQVIGLQVTRIAPEGVEARIEMKPELVGHFAYNRMHGGVISSALDAMAGLAVMAAIGARHMDEPPAKRLQRFAKLGTIDLRMEFLSAKDELLSVGTASYIVS